MNNFSSKMLLVVWVLAYGLGANLPVAVADVNKLASQCADCHGKDGASTTSDIPIIGGISQQYMIDSMAAYKNKERPCLEEKYQSGPKKGQKTDMCHIAKELSDADVKALAKYFSGKKFVRAKQPFDAGKAKKGKELHAELCDKCHVDGGSSPEDDAGILAGQHKAYLDLSFKQYSEGKRPMPKKMKPKFEKLTPADKEALIQYYISQQ